MLKELRVGNKILYLGCPITVDVDVLSDMENYGYGYAPAPLTEDILSRCLDYDGMEWNLTKEPTSWSIQSYSGKFGLAYGGDLSKETWIEYVHELQNLFHCLTGKELEVIIKVFS